LRREIDLDGDLSLRSSAPDQDGEEKQCSHAAR
jgi:hypothetical protein